MTATNVGSYGYLRADGVPVAHPLFQAGGGGSIPTSALQLRFAQSDVRTALELNALWHSVLPNLAIGNVKGGGPLHVCYTAEYEGGYYAAAIWSTPIALNRMRWTGDEVLELRRMAIADNAPKNTATRMLGWMTRDIRKRFPSLVVLISYQAVDHHEGTIYKAAGWNPGPVIPFRAHEHKKGRGAPTQTTSDKVRWELQLRKPAAEEAS